MRGSYGRFNIVAHENRPDNRILHGCYHFNNSKHASQGTASRVFSHNVPMLNLKAKSHSGQQNVASSGRQSCQQLRTRRSACEVRFEGLPDRSRDVHVIPHDFNADLDCRLMACSLWNAANLGWHVRLNFSVSCLILSLALSLCPSPLPVRANLRHETRQNHPPADAAKTFANATVAQPELLCPFSTARCHVVLGNVRDSSHSPALNIST